MAGYKTKKNPNKKTKQKNNSKPLPLMTHFLKIPLPSKTAPPAGEQVFKYLSLWRTLLIQVTTGGDESQLGQKVFTGTSSSTPDPLLGSEHPTNNVMMT